VPLAEPCDRQRDCQTSSYHPTPRGLPHGVTRFYPPFCEFSHPSAADLGLSLASTRAAKPGPKRDRFPEPLPPFRPKLSDSRSHDREQELAPRAAIRCPSLLSPAATGPAPENTCSNEHAGTPQVRQTYAVPATFARRPQRGTNRTRHPSGREGTSAPSRARTPRGAYPGRATSAYPAAQALGEGIGAPSKRAPSRGRGALVPPRQQPPFSHARAAWWPKTLRRPASAWRKRVYGRSAKGGTPALRYNPTRSGSCYRLGRRCPPSQTRSAQATQEQRR